MAKKSVGKTTVASSPKAQKNAKVSKGILPLLATIVTVIAIITVVLGGVFYLIIQNNYKGLAERYRSSIMNVPLLKHALPIPPDPLDPKYMTESEMKEKYTEFRMENEALKKQRSEMNIKLDEYQKYKDEHENLNMENDKKLQEIKERMALLDEEEIKLKNLKKEIDERTVKGDKEAFKEYFETLDPENAKLLYSEVVKEQQVNVNIKKFAQVYAAMDADAAAKVFESLGNTKIDMVSETLKAMSKESSSAILESMTPAYAAKVTERLNELFRSN